MQEVGPYSINKVYCEDCLTSLKKIPDGVFNLMVTSPPYNIDISYGNEWKGGKIKQSKGVKYSDNMEEKQYREFIGEVMKECIRTLSDMGSIYLNIKNRYIDEQIVPPFWVLDYFSEMYLKNTIIWSFDWGGSTNKRFCSRYEYVFFFTKNKKTWTFNLDDVKVPSLNYRPDRYKSQLKNPSDVRRIPIVSGNSPERTSHPAQYPEKLIERIIKVSTNEGDLILDPFIGSGTTGVVAKNLGRNFIGFDTNIDYVNIANERIFNGKIIE